MKNHSRFLDGGYVCTIVHARSRSALAKASTISWFEDSFFQAEVIKCWNFHLSFEIFPKKLETKGLMTTNFGWFANKWTLVWLILITAVCKWGLMAVLICLFSVQKSDVWWQLHVKEFFWWRNNILEKYIQIVMNYMMAKECSQSDHHLCIEEDGSADRLQPAVRFYFLLRMTLKEILRKMFGNLKTGGVQFLYSWQELIIFLPRCEEYGIWKSSNLYYTFSRKHLNTRWRDSLLNVGSSKKINTKDFWCLLSN